jgi:hypothetical protein
MLLLSTAGDSIYLSSQNSSGSTYHIYRVADGKYMLLGHGHYADFDANWSHGELDNGIRRDEWDEGRRFLIKQRAEIES